MTSFIQNMLWNSVSGFVEAGTRTAGQYAGDALIKAGDVIEGSGRSVGNGIERRASNYGSAISGGQPSKATTGATKPSIQRSNSSPASSKPAAAKSAGSKATTPLGASKPPSGKQAGQAAKKATGSAQKTAGGVVSGAQKSVGGIASGAQKSIGGATNSGAPKTTPSSSNNSNTPRTLPKPYPQNTPASKPPTNNNKTNNNPLPKPYNAHNAASSYPSNPYPSSQKATAVKPGQPKPFTPPAPAAQQQQKQGQGQGGAGGKPSYPGQGSKTPVQNQKKGVYKPMERLGPQQQQGEKGKGMQHIAV